jgi:hypothetical protein
MFRFLIVAAAVAAGAWALIRKHFKPEKTHTTIVIGGAPSNPVITQQPETLYARPGRLLTWQVQNNNAAPQKIELRGFRKDNIPGGSRAADDTGATVPAGDTDRLSTRVHGNARKGDYKYDIDLNGQLALDPDVVIWEEGGG